MLCAVWVSEINYEHVIYLFTRISSRCSRVGKVPSSYFELLGSNLGPKSVYSEVSLVLLSLSRKMPT